jgi:hypothetical protein
LRTSGLITSMCVKERDCLRLNDALSVPKRTIPPASDSSTPLKREARKSLVPYRCALARLGAHCRGFHATHANLECRLVFRNGGFRIFSRSSDSNVSIVYESNSRPATNSVWAARAVWYRAGFPGICSMASRPCPLLAASPLSFASVFTIRGICTARAVAISQVGADRSPVSDGPEE